MWLIPHDQGISRELGSVGIHEPLITQVLRKELKEGMTCIDVGSNIGYYALIESKTVGANGMVLAFEPSSTSYEYLTKNKIHNAATNIHTYNIAVGDRDGVLQLLVRNESNLTRVSDIVIEDKADGYLQDAQCTTLDSFVRSRNLPGVDFIRMDVEGYEYHMFNGMTKTIQKYKPMMLIEFHNSVLGIERTIELLRAIEN